VWCDVLCVDVLLILTCTFILGKFKDGEKSGERKYLTDSNGQAILRVKDDDGNLLETPEKIYTKEVEIVKHCRVVNAKGNRHYVVRDDTGKEELVGRENVKPLQNPNVFKYSPDGKYVARLGDDMITVYTLPDMKILDRTSIKAPNVLSFEWSPTANVISYYVPGIGM